jgi:hypothetical protein
MLGNYYGVSAYSYSGGNTYHTNSKEFDAVTDLQADATFASQFNFKGT